MELYKQVNSQRNTAELFKHTYYFDLGVICELSKIDPKSENALGDLIKNAFLNLNNHFCKGLSSIYKQAFILAAHYSLRSQQNFKTVAFSFLVARASVLIDQKADFDSLTLNLKKRQQPKNTLDTTDKKLIAEIQLSSMEAKLMNKVPTLKKYDQFIELPIALAELEFIQKKTVKGFNVLEQHTLKIKKSNNSRYLDFIDEALRFAKQEKNKKAEEFYLLIKFVDGYFIDENDLQRFFEITNILSIETTTNELIKKIKEESVFYTFEKLAVVLLHQNRINELIEEIKPHKNKFKLLHKLAIHLLPNYDLLFLKLYTKHFITAVADAKFPYFQEQLVNLAKTYLDCLPNKTRTTLLEEVKEKMIYNRHASDYLEQLYETNLME